MMNALRNAARGVVAKVLLGLLVLSFAVWGVSGAFTGGYGDTVIAAGDTEITANEYRLEYTQQRNELSRRFGTALTAEQAAAIGVESAVLNQLVTGAVLDEQTSELGLGITEDELARVIASDSTFTNFTGSFDRAIGRRILAQIGMSEAEYIDRQTDIARRRQLLSAVASEAYVPEVFTAAERELAAQSRDISFIAITEDTLPPLDPPTDEELAAWFEENASAFEAPEYRTVTYARLSPETLADPQSVNADDVRAFYDENAERFATPATRDVSRLLFASREDAETAAARVADGTATFEQIVEEQGRDVASITRTAQTRTEYTDQSIVDEVFALGEGEVSGVLDGGFGAIIARVANIQEEGVRTFEDVEDEIRREIAENDAADALYDVSDAYEDARAGGATIDEAAREARLEVLTIEGVDENGMLSSGEPAEVPVREILAGAFAAEEGEENPVLDDGAGGLIWYEVTAIEPARARTLDEARDEALEAFTAERRAEALSRLAAEEEGRLRGGETLEEVASRLGVEVQRAFAAKRGAASGSLPADVIDAAFDGPQGHAALVPRGAEGYVLLRVDAVAEDAGLAEAEAERPSSEDDILAQFVADLRERYTLNYNADLAEQLRSLEY